MCLCCGACEFAAAEDRDVGACCRKAAKKVERKKGRWEDMVRRVDRVSVVEFYRPLEGRERRVAIPGG